MKSAWTAASVAVCLMIGACGGHVPARDVTPNELLERAIDQIERGDHLKAIEELTRLTIDYPGLAFIDRVVFYLGKAHLEAGEYELAEVEFSRLLRDYPFSEYADDAAFARADAYFRQRGKPSLDPTAAENALDEFTRFLDEHAESPLLGEATERIRILREHLAEKKLRNAQLYARRNHHASALVYARAVVREYPETPQAVAALGVLARSSARLDDRADACDAVGRLRSLLPDPSASALLVELRSEMAAWGCPESDSTEASLTPGR